MFGQGKGSLQDCRILLAKLPGSVRLAIPLGGILEAVNVVPEAIAPHRIVAFVEGVDLALVWDLQCKTAVRSW